MMKEMRALFVPYCFNMEYYPTNGLDSHWVQFLQYAEACARYGWPLISNERMFQRFSQMEEVMYGASLKDIAKLYGFNRLPTSEEIRNIAAYPISQAEEDAFLSKFASREDCCWDLVYNENSEFKQITDKLLDKIIRDYGKSPEGIIVFNAAPKILKCSADERGIPILCPSAGNLRPPFGENMNGCVLLNETANAETIGQKYDRFMAESEDVPFLSRKGILRLFVNRQYLKDIHLMDMKPEYEAGILYNSIVTLFQSEKPGWKTDEEMFEIARAKYKNVLVRARPGTPIEVEADNSPTCFHFCCKCRHVVGAVTKGLFEAMLAGRVAHEYGAYLFHSFCNDGIEDESKGVAPVEFINYILFGIYMPFGWHTNQEYLSLLLNEKSEKTIYMKKFSHYTQGISKKDLELYYMTSGREYRVGDMLYFSDGHLPHEYASYYCTGGLHVPAGTHTWSSGEITSFEFDLIESINEPLAITVLLNEVAMDWNTPNPAQAVECDVNGINCGSAILTPQIKYMRFTVPAECFSDKLRVTFRYSYLHLSGETKIAVAFVSMYVKCGSQRLIEDELFSELERHNSENKRLNAELARLSAVNAEMNGVVASIYNSRSWKLGHAVTKTVAKLIPRKR